MKCRECGRTKRNGMWKTLCWTKYQICGKCARRTHPELYAEINKTRLLNLKNINTDKE